MPATNVVVNQTDVGAVGSPGPADRPAEGVQRGVILLLLLVVIVQVRIAVVLRRLRILLLPRLHPLSVPRDAHSQREVRKIFFPDCKSVLRGGTGT